MAKVRRLGFEGCLRFELGFWVGLGFRARVNVLVLGLDWAWKRVWVFRFDKGLGLSLNWVFLV